MHTACASHSAASGRKSLMLFVTTAFAARDLEDNPVAAPGQVLAAGCRQEPSTAAGSVSVTQFRNRYSWLAKVSRSGQEGGRPGTGTMPLLGCGR